MSEKARLAPVFRKAYEVSFGDCDPAGIVFYPNIFAWFDRTFHAYLRHAGGGHAAVCTALKARGLGVVDVQCAFRSPMTEGNMLHCEIQSIEWGASTFLLTYQGRVDDTIVFEGEEKRAVFVEKDGRLRAGDVAALKAQLREL